MGWKTTIILAWIIILITACSVWSSSGRVCVEEPVESFLMQIEELGKDTGCGNLLAVQPYMMASDYASPERFQAKLELYIKETEKVSLLFFDFYLTDLKLLMIFFDNLSDKNLKSFPTFP